LKAIDPRVWRYLRVADFTYIWTAEGWLYVSAVIDLFSRRVVGWSMNANMTAQLVADALLMAVWRRGKAPQLPNLPPCRRSVQGGFVRQVRPRDRGQLFCGLRSDQTPDPACCAWIW
jgi:transposase InsO family protein